jgi:hypothetical protein
MWEGIQLMKEKKNSGSLFMMEGAVVENVLIPLSHQ